VDVRWFCVEGLECRCRNRFFFGRVGGGILVYFVCLAVITPPRGGGGHW